MGKTNFLSYCNYPRLGVDWTVIGFDVDGVLADKPPASKKKWGRMNGLERHQRRDDLLDWYANADVLLRPTEAFIAISARRNDPSVRSVTEKWLDTYQPHCVGLFLLPVSRSIKNVVAFKRAVVNAQKLTDFTEDNKAILRGLLGYVPNTRLWYFDKTLETPVAFS